MQIRTVHVQTLVGTPLAQQVRVGSHQLVADEPLEANGEDRGLAPSEWLLAGLGACTSMTVKLYAQAKNWPLDEVHVQLDGTSERASLAIVRTITLVGTTLTAEQRQRLLEIANKCPVHRILTGEISITSSLTPSA